jgi:hypothetical protein
LLAFQSLTTPLLAKGQGILRLGTTTFDSWLRIRKLRRSTKILTKNFQISLPSPSIARSTKGPLASSCISSLDLT